MHLGRFDQWNLRADCGVRYPDIKQVKIYEVRTTEGNNPLWFTAKMMWEDIFGCNTIDSQPKHKEAGYYIDITGDCNSTQKCEDS